MEAAQLHPCPLCDSSVIRWQRDGQEWHTINACAHCGIFVVASPSLPHPWARLAPEDALLVAFLPAYIQHCNRHDRTPLLTLENWRALARRGRIVALRTPAKPMCKQEAKARQRIGGQMKGSAKLRMLQKPAETRQYSIPDADQETP